MLRARNASVVRDLVRFGWFGGGEFDETFGHLCAAFLGAAGAAGEAEPGGRGEGFGADLDDRATRAGLDLDPDPDPAAEAAAQPEDQFVVGAPAFDQGDGQV